MKKKELSSNDLHQILYSSHPRFKAVSQKVVSSKSEEVRTFGIKHDFYSQDLELVFKSKTTGKHFKTKYSREKDFTPLCDCFTCCYHYGVHQYPLGSSRYAFVRSIEFEEIT